MSDVADITSNAMQTIRKAKNPKGMATAGAALSPFPMRPRAFAKLRGATEGGRWQGQGEGHRQGQGRGRRCGRREAQAQHAQGRRRRCSRRSARRGDGDSDERRRRLGPRQRPADADPAVGRRRGPGQGRLQPLDPSSRTGRSSCTVIESAEQVDDATVSFSGEDLGDHASASRPRSSSSVPTSGSSGTSRRGYAHTGVVTFHELAPTTLTRIEVTPRHPARRPDREGGPGDALREARRARRPAPVQGLRRARRGEPRRRLARHDRGRQGQEKNSAEIEPLRFAWEVQIRP